MVCSIIEVWNKLNVNTAANYSPLKLAGHAFANVVATGIAGGRLSLVT